MPDGQKDAPCLHLTGKRGWDKQYFRFSVGKMEFTLSGSHQHVERAHIHRDRVD